MSNQPAVLGPDGISRPYIGGQALIEGVMMRSPHAFAAVVRRKGGELVVREQPMVDLRKGVRAWPLVRGAVALVESLRLGSRALRFSVDVYERDLNTELHPQPAKPSSPSLLTLLSLPIVALMTNEPEPSPTSGFSDDKKGSGWLTLFSVGVALTLFVALPQAFAAGTSALFKLELDVRSVAFQAMTGAAKMVILISYMLVIRRAPEIYRVFQFHGAEHKSIHTYESGEALSVENARKKTTLHPRCGTTFIVMVALVSIFVFSMLGPFLPKLGLSKLADNVLFFLIKLPFLPFIAAVTFELQRLLARFATRGPLRALLWPGFLVQKVTTIEPDDTQLEVALGALAVTLGREKGRGEERVEDRQYPNYAELLSGTAAAG